jgi:iron(III) transport system substrate-binding protein
MFSPKAMVAASLGLVLALSGCASETNSNPQPSNTSAESSESITLYSGRAEDLIAPLIAIFTAETGIEVNVRYGESSEMAATILEEGKNTKADVFFSQDAGALGAVSQEATTYPLPEEVVNLSPAKFRAKMDLGLAYPDDHASLHITLNL